MLQFAIASSDRMNLASEPTDLQFDRAEFDAGAAAHAACHFCKRTLTEHYFDVNSLVVCADCRDAIAREQAKTAGASGVLKAIGAGLGAGLAGAIVYYLVLVLTGYELALISIAVGYAVGRAVRWGSGGRGGRLYQVIAVMITYVAIVGSYTPMVITQMQHEIDADRKAAAVAGQTSNPATPTTAGTPARARPVDGFMVLRSLMGAIILFILLLPVPLMTGLQNIIGLIIIGLALYEAWKTTRRVQLTITGPFTLTPGEPAQTAASASATASAG